MTSAAAVDLPVKAPVAPAMLPLWTGFYVGANGGYSWGPWDSSSIETIFPGGTGLTTTASPKVNGWVAGIQGGYNWQINPTWVVGLEGDFQGTGERQRTDGAFTTSIALQGLTTVITLTESAEWKFPWFATFRGRVGGLITPSTLLYVTGGLAVGRFDFSVVSMATAATFRGVVPVGAPASASVGFDESTTRVGGAVGAGVEQKFDRNWSAKLEYLYLDFGDHTFLAGTGFDTNVRLRDHALRAGLNYQFN